MFGCLVAGRPIQTDCIQITPTQYKFTLAAPSSIKHLAVFLTQPLPESMCAIIFWALPLTSAVDWTRLGCIWNEKASAIYRLDGIAEGSQTIEIGISIEPLRDQPESNAVTTTTPPSTKKTKEIEEIAGSLFNFVASWAKDRAEFEEGTHVVPLAKIQDWYNRKLYLR